MNRGQNTNHERPHLLNMNYILPSDEFQAFVVCKHAIDHTFNVVARNPNGTSYTCAASYDLSRDWFSQASKKWLRHLFEHGSADGIHLQCKFSHDAFCICTTSPNMNYSNINTGEVRLFVNLIPQSDQLNSSYIHKSPATIAAFATSASPTSFRASAPTSFSSQHLYTHGRFELTTFLRAAVQLT
jgi:hypothetical protein